MAASKTGKRVTQKAKIAALEAENDELKASIERLKDVNAEQLRRLVDQTLLEGRMSELQKLIAKQGDE